MAEDDHLRTARRQPPFEKTRSGLILNEPHRRSPTRLALVVSRSDLRLSTASPRFGGNEAIVQTRSEASLGKRGTRLTSKSCHTGEACLWQRTGGRCRWQKWVRASAGKTRAGAVH